MTNLGFKFPSEQRKTFLYDLEENWYTPLLAKLRNLPIQSTKRNNFGQYSMAVNYLTSVLEEAQAVNKLAIYNIDHMAQLRFWGKDVVALLNRSLAGNFSDMKIGQCKYTLLLNAQGGVQDDMILMRVTETEFIIVINAGHDITDTVAHHADAAEQEVLIADIDRIMANILDGEEVFAEDISDKLVKVDVQGPLSFKLVKQIFGGEVLKNRNNPDKNMNYFSFNEFTRKGQKYYISRTGYTNRWGWELYLPTATAEEDFKAIMTLALELGGLLVGLGGRDENRISAGAFGLPLMGQEYDPMHTPTNAPLFEAAVDMTKEDFVGKAALAKEISSGAAKSSYIIVSEGIVSHRGIYKDGKRLGSVTSSINSPNVSLEMRTSIGSKRKNVNEEHGTAAIGLGWFYSPLFAKDADGKEISEADGKAIRIPLEFYREDAEGKPTGSPTIGYATLEGISAATAPKPLKNIENL
ncbi:MAG: aminomethyltransferase [Candidatus Cloacimonetes bacterium HGW-Cloacimonetes-3]|jgi:aminomethyltransferase|nr:MAG: aminomethyltransferase [Candidatus Cloacimonetes bacterium HGW-Cloacimonetes-3]